MKYIGIDFGSKRVGLAVSDENGSVAFPKMVIETNKALKELVQFCIHENIEHIVIGESKDFLMKDNAIAKQAKEFAESLAKETKLPLSFQSEVFSSHQASKELHHAHTPREQSVRNEKRSPNLDAQAAAIILQSFLNSK